MRSSSSSSISGATALLKWVQGKVKGSRFFPDLEVVNFTTSWSDGRAFCALLSLVDADEASLCKFDTPEERKKTFSVVFGAFERRGVPKLLEEEDMLISVPERLSIMTYVSEIRKRWGTVSRESEAAAEEEEEKTSSSFVSSPQPSSPSPSSSLLSALGSPQQQQEEEEGKKEEEVEGGEKSFIFSSPPSSRSPSSTSRQPSSSSRLPLQQSPSSSSSSFIFSSSPASRIPLSPRSTSSPSSRSSPPPLSSPRASPPPSDTQQKYPTSPRNNISSSEPKEKENIVVPVHRLFLVLALFSTSLTLLSLSGFFSFLPNLWMFPPSAHSLEVILILRIIPISLGHLLATSAFIASATLYLRSKSISSFSSFFSSFSSPSLSPSFHHYGVWALTRFPEYTSLVLCLASVALLFNSLYITVATLLFFAYLHWVVTPREETILRHKYGQQYEEYCTNVNRWLLF